MRFDIMTLFPELVDTVLSSSIIGRARNSGAIEVVLHQIRDYSEDKHRRVDDTPYGGGMGMLMAPGPVYRCYLDVLRQAGEAGRRRVIYMSPQGKLLTQKKVRELAGCESLILLCGHYEGIDCRVIDAICDEELSIGDYVLTGGELPACILVDSVARCVEGVLADESCYLEESVACGMLEYPQYTKPAEFLGKKVPEVLLSGDHAAVKRWRYEQALEKTKRCRPDLL